MAQAAGPQHSLPGPESGTVSVVIPFHNAGRFLEEALRSCEGRCSEVVLVDDGSDDESVGIARRWAQQRPEFIRLCSQARAGVAAARNAGLHAASGVFVLFLDADDLLSFDLLAVARRAADADLYVGAWANFKDNTPERPSVVDARSLEWIRLPAARAVRLRPVVSAMLFRRRADMPAWRGEYLVWEVFAFMAEYIALPQVRVAMGHEVLSHVRQHDSAGRLSIVHDHFEPFNTGSFFARWRDFFRSRLDDPELGAALDSIVMANAYALMRRGEFARAASLLASIRLADIWRYSARFFGKYIWVARVLGPRAGVRLFFSVNALMGRV